MSFQARVVPLLAPIILTTGLLVIGAASLGGAPTPTALHVERTADNVMLLSPSGAQTISMLDGGKTGWYYDAAEETLEFVGRVCANGKGWSQTTCRMDTIVLLGLGGGEMLRGAHRAAPQASLVGVEIDSHVIELASGGDFGTWPPRTTFVRADAIEWISTEAELRPGSIDVLMVDLYNDDKIVEASTRTVFFADCARALRPSGTFIMNVNPGYRAEGIKQRLAPFFHTFSKDYGGNSIVVAGVRR